MCNTQKFFVIEPTNGDDAPQNSSLSIRIPSLTQSAFPRSQNIPPTESL